MNIHKTKIDWATHSWNPVTGCKHGCEYCYARNIARRFGPRATERPADGSQIIELENYHGCYEMLAPANLVDGEGKTRTNNFPTGFAPTLHKYMLDFPEKKIAPGRIFVGSMTDLFGSWVPTRWIIQVLDACAKAEQHRYLFLTKNPKRYAELNHLALLPLGAAFWYGATAVNSAQATEAGQTFQELPVEARTFLSVEPMLCDITETEGWEALRRGLELDWIIVGAMTGAGARKNRPRREWIENLVSDAAAAQVPVFMKNSLQEIWGGELIQEYPKELEGGAGSEKA